MDNIALRGAMDQKKDRPNRWNKISSVASMKMVVSRY